MADIDRLEIEVEAQAGKANKQLDNLINKLERVSSALTGVNASGLTGFAKGIEKMAGASAQLGNVKTADFTRLAKNLEKMAGVDQSSLNRTASSLITISKSLGSLKGVSESSTQISEMAKNIAKLGNKSVQNAMENMPKLASGLNEMMGTLSKAPTVSNNLIQMTNALASLASQGSKVGSAVNSMGVKGARGTSLLSGFLERLTGSTGRATKATKSFSQIAGSFYANFYVVMRGLRKAWSATESSMDFLETVNYFEVAMRKLGDDAAVNWHESGKSSAEEYAKSFAERAKQLTAKMTGYNVDEDGNATYAGIKNLGMNPEAVMNYQAMFAQVSESIGVAEESALRFSDALTMLGADWASLRNTTFDQAWGKFASALAGQSRAVRAFGIDITNATLQEYAYKYGLTQAIQEMNQATKAQLRLLAILDQSKVAYGDLTNTMQSPANQLRMLRQNFANLARAIGNLFLPVVQKVLPYINGLVMAVQRLFTWIGSLFGIKFNSINSSIGGMDNGVEDLVDGAEDAESAIDGANDAAKKLKNTVLGFDELNQLNDNTDSSGGSNSGSGIGGGSPILDEEIANALAEYQKAWDESFNRMENKAQDIADRICNAFKRGDYEGIGKYIGNGITKGLEKINWNAVYSVSKNFGKGFAEFLNGLISPSLFGTVGKTIAGAMNTAIYAELSFGKNFDFKNLGNSIAAGINSFFSTYDFKSLAQTYNVWAKGILDTIITALDNTDWSMIGKQIGTFLEELDFMEVGAKIGKAVWKAINAGIEVFSGMFKAAPIETTIVTILGFSKAWKALFGENVISGIKKITKKLSIFKDTAIITTKALKGNEKAAGALQLLWPELSKKVDRASSIFKSFKNLFKGNFFGNLKTEIGNIGSKMTGLQKGATGAIAVFGEFSLVKSGFKDLASGADNLVASIGKIAVGAGGAATALYAAFGPAGLVIAGITGVVGAVKGINDAFEEIKTESIGNAIKDALTNPGGKSLDELAKNFSDKMLSIGDGFREIANKSQQLDGARASIENTVTSLEAIDRAMDTSSISTEEGCRRIKEALGSLSTDASGSIHELETTLLSALGEGGIMYEMMDTLGYDVEGLKNVVAATSEAGIKYIEDLNAELDTLDAANPTDAARIREIEKALVDFTHETDETTKAYDEFQESLQNNKINLSELVEYKDGEISYKTDKFNSSLNTLKTSVEDIRTAVKDGVDGIKNDTELLKKMADTLGLDENSAEFKEAMEIYAEVLEETNGDVDKAAKALTDTLETQLLEEVENVIENAGDAWESMNPLERFAAGSKSEYVNEAVQSYKKNIADPMSKGIKDVMDGLEIEGAGWSRTKIDTMIADLFGDAKKSVDAGYKNLNPVLKENYEEIVKKYANEAKKEVSGTSDSVINSLSQVGTALGNTSAAFGSLSGSIRSTTSSSSNDISTLKVNSLYDFSAITGAVGGSEESMGKFGDKITSVTSSSGESISGFSQVANDKFTSTALKADSLTSTLDGTTTSAENLHAQSGKTFDIKTDDNSFNRLRNNISGVFDAVNSLFSFNGRSLSIGASITGVMTGGRGIGVSGYASGGFPTSGQLFMARENGINEMVGHIGNRSAVANNEQIVEGIRAAVVDGMMEVMMAFSGQQGNAPSEPVVEFTWKTENETIYKMAAKGKESHDGRYHIGVEL